MKFKELLQNWGLEFLILGWFFFVLYPFGPAVTYDSVSFLEAGGNFLFNGEYVHSGAEGLEFAAHRFPLYPIILLVRSFIKDTLFNKTIEQLDIQLGKKKRLRRAAQA